MGCRGGPWEAPWYAVKGMPQVVPWYVAEKDNNVHVDSLVGISVANACPPLTDPS